MRIFGGEKQIRIETDSLQVASKLVEGTFPNYRQVIPSQCEQRIAVTRELLLSALHRVSLVMSDKTAAMKLTFGRNKLVVMVNAPDVGEARETVTIKYAGKEVTIAFNPDFMMDPLRNLTSDEIYLEITDEMSPGVIKTDTPFLYVLMPMRVS